MALITFFTSKTTLHQKRIIFSISIFVFVTLFDETLSLNSKFEACAPQTCDASDVEIKYPFWISSRQHPFCGHPNFQITCNQTNPILSISNENYIIKDVSYANHSLLVANAKAYDVDTCPAPIHNLTLDRTPFNTSITNTNLYLLYNCTYRPPVHIITYPIDCVSSNTGANYSFAGFDMDELEKLNYTLDTCRYLVYVPVDVVSRDDGVDDIWRRNYTEILKMGFMLNWTAHGCSKCEKSGGRCGFDDNEFVCFCKDRTYPKTCHDGDSGPNNKAKIGIAFGAAFGGMGVTAIIFFILLRRHKKKYALSSYVSGNSTGYSNQSSFRHTEKGDSSTGVRLFTYTELEVATNHFDSSKELGDGGFGTVYYGKLQDGRKVAVKRLYENNYKRVEQFMNEVDILAGLRHPNLVSLYGSTSRHSRELLLVYEYVSNGTLADHLHGHRSKPGSLTWSTRLKIAIETASALSYLHASEIVHRDVKTNNILLDENFHVKVADFGLSRLFPMDVTHVSTAPQGTPGYVDPEYHQCYQLTDKSDVFSFGVVLIELISSMPAVDITRHRHEINLSNLAINKIQNKALQQLVDPNLGFEADYAVKKMINAVAELAFRCLQGDKDMRPCMADVLEGLKSIENEGNGRNKAEEMDIPSDDVVLLKSGQLTLSPDSVTVNWISSTTTPNVSS